MANSVYVKFEVPKEIADKVISSTDNKKRTIKAKETLQKLYGVDYIGQLPQSIKNSHSDKAVAKQKQTYNEIKGKLLGFLRIKCRL